VWTVNENELWKRAMYYRRQEHNLRAAAFIYSLRGDKGMFWFYQNEAAKSWFLWQAATRDALALKRYYEYQYD
jgi:hypothetical protein